MKFKKRYVVIPVMVIVCLLILGRLFLEFINLPTFQFFGEIIPRVNTDKKVIALTFDDGPTEYTDDVLAVVNENKIKTTFFMIGKDIEKNPTIAAQVVKDGHQLANHSYNHQRNVFKSYDFYKNEVDATNALIRKAGYKGELMFRPPYGKKFIGLPHYLASQNMKTIMWDVEPDTNADWKNQENVGYLINNTLENTKPGSIIIIHPFCDKECADARKALPVIIDKLRKEGYTFVTVAELLKYQE